MEPKAGPALRPQLAKRQGAFKLNGFAKVSLGYFDADVFYPGVFWCGFILIVSVELIERLIAARDSDHAWEILQGFAAELGCTAVNMASANAVTGALNWSRMGMDEAWLERYVSQNYVAADPVALNLARDVPLQVIQAGTLRREDVDNPLEWQINHELAEAGYNSLVAVQTAGRMADERQVLVFASDAAEVPLFVEHGIEGVQQIGRLASAFVSAPKVWRYPQNSIGTSARLTGREVDVLSLLALGHRNDRIAERLQISEVMVRKHLSAARIKLGAKTREQALVRAILQGIIHI